MSRCMGRAAVQLAPESPFMSCGVGCNGYTTPEVLAQR
jgi:hypothetical protein